MGLAASQIRFLQLTSRKHDIGRKLQHLSLEKMSLTRDMQRLTKKYNEALSSKVMKWSINNGVTYSDLSYSTLMHPGAANKNKPVLLTDSAGKVVVDSKYEKYAKMISADGSSGGDWESKRTEILSSILGIDANTIETSNTTSKAVSDANSDRYSAKKELDEWMNCELTKGQAKYQTAEECAKYIGVVSGQNFSDLYKSGGTVVVNSTTDLEKYAQGIYNNMEKYFVDDDTVLNVNDKTKFKEACDAFVSHYKVLLGTTGNNADTQREQAGLSGSSGNWTISVQNIFNHIMNTYSGSGTTGENRLKQTTYAIRDTSSGSTWDQWYQQLKSLNTTYEESETAYASSCETDNEVLDASQETLISFYDQIFEAIARCGWVYDMSIGDSDYLDQSLQNNQYYLTIMSENSNYDSSVPESSSNNKYEFETSVATNFDNIFLVNDQSVRDAALNDYSYEKLNINTKESKIDEMMKNLETEQSSINKMLESIEKVKNDNIEARFKIFA